MLLDVRNLQDVRKFLAVFQGLGVDSQASGAQSTIAALFNNPAVIRVFPLSNDAPQWSFTDLGDDLLVQSYGISTFQQAVNLVTSSEIPMKASGNWSAGGIYLDTADFIYRSLLFYLPTMARRFTLVGYSFGGGVVEVLAALIGDRQPSASVQVLAVGSPRPGGMSLQQRLQNVQLIRLMNDNDPVPRFVPHLLEAPAANLTVGFLISFLWSLYVQPNGGVELDDNGRFRIRPLPGRSGPFADLNLVRWLRSAEGELHNGHAVQTYQNRVKAAVDSGTVLIPGALPLPGGEAPQKLTGEAFTAARTSPAAAQLLLEGGETVQGYIPPDFRAGVIRLGSNSWAVVWMGTPLFQGSNRSHIRSLAKKLNAFLRRMQSDTEVFQGRLNEAVGLYLAKASNATAGFIPTMNLQP